MGSASEDLLSGCGKWWARCRKTLSNVPHRVLELHHFEESGRGFKRVRGWLLQVSFRKGITLLPHTRRLTLWNVTQTTNLQKWKSADILNQTLCWATMTQVEGQGSALNGGSNLLFRKIVCFESCHFRSASYTSQTVFSLLFQDMNWGVKRNPADFVRKIKTSDYLISLLCHWSLVFRLQLGGRNSS